MASHLDPGLERQPIRLFAYLACSLLVTISGPEKVRIMPHAKEAELANVLAKRAFSNLSVLGHGFVHLILVCRRPCHNLMLRSRFESFSQVDGAAHVFGLVHG